jgi:NTE family protein
MDLKNLILKGGGEKGVAYLGVLSALIESGNLDSFDKISGTSVGAIAGLILSAGYTEDEIQNQILSTNFAKLVYGKNGFERFVNDLESPYELFANGGIHKGEEFYKWFQEVVEHATGNKDATFRDWHEYKLKHPEKGLKDLYVKAFYADLKIDKTFSWESEFCDVPIAQAVRGSMAVPGFFTKQSIVDKTRGVNGWFADGGTRDNYPCGVFEDNNQPNKNSLGLWLGTKSEINYIKNGTDPEFVKINNGFEALLAAFDGALDQQAATIRASKTRIDQIVFIDTDDLTTLNFSPSKELLKKVVLNAYTATKKFLEEKGLWAEVNPRTIDKLLNKIDKLPEITSNYTSTANNTPLASDDNPAVVTHQYDHECTQLNKSSSEVEETRRTCVIV